MCRDARDLSEAISINKLPTLLPRLSLDGGLPNFGDPFLCVKYFKSHRCQCFWAVQSL